MRDAKEIGPSLARTLDYSFRGYSSGGSIERLMKAYFALFKEAIKADDSAELIRRLEVLSDYYKFDADDCLETGKAVAYKFGVASMHLILQLGIDEKVGFEVLTGDPGCYTIAGALSRVHEQLKLGHSLALACEKSSSLFGTQEIVDCLKAGRASGATRDALKSLVDAPSVMRG